MTMPALLFDYQPGLDLAHADGDRLNAMEAALQLQGSGMINLQFLSGFQLANADGDKLNALVAVIEHLSQQSLGISFRPGVWYENTEGSKLNTMVVAINGITNPTIPIITHGAVTVAATFNVGDVKTATVVWRAADNSIITPNASTAWTASTGALTFVVTGLTSASVTAVSPASGVVVTATDPGTGVTCTSSVTISDPITQGVITAASSLNVQQVVGATVLWKGFRGNTIVPSMTSTWLSTDTGKFTVASTGLVAANMTGVALGSSTLRATDPTTGVIANQSESVLDPITNGTVTLGTSVNVLGTLDGTVLWKGVGGNTITPIATTTWASSNNTDLTVVSTGQNSVTATGQAAGSSLVVTATNPTTGSTATKTGITVSDPIILGTVTVTNSFLVGQVVPATVVWTGAKGNTLTPIATTTWLSSDVAGMTVASTGLNSANVTGVGAESGLVLTATNPTTGILDTAVTNVNAASGNAAQFITNSLTSGSSVSSLDSGRICYFVAWGGNEFGYAYTYSLSGSPPAGVTIDADMGILSIASPLTAGSYTFNVVATNRENAANVASFSFTLPVVTGVTSGRSGTQVLHKTYDPSSGSFGTVPGVGGDWTTILQAIKSQILADQTTNGEERLRATIPFHKGTTYNYTNNDLLTGVQYYDVTATGSGASPILRNNGSGVDYQGGPLNIGNSGSMNRGGFRKSLSAKISTVAAGATSVTCVTHAQTSRLVVGRWHCVIGQAIQMAGEPPNLMFLDWVIVTAVNASTGVVTLDRPLKYAYDSTWWENPADDISFGTGWIYPADTDSNGRATLRGRFSGINFQANPNGSTIMLLQSHVQSDFDNCTTTNYQVTLGKHYALYNSNMVNEGEPDKQSETLFLDNTTLDGLGGVTGFSYCCFRNSTATNSGIDPNTIQISPRQFRSIGSKFDARNSTSPPYNFSFNGPNWYLDFKSTIFTGAVGNIWTYGGSSFSPLTFGAAGNWSGTQLQIPVASGNFEAWLINSYAGAIVAVTANALGPITANWGYVSSVTSPGDGTALWLNITWVQGSKPTTGSIDIVGARFRRLFMESTCSFTGSLVYNDARMSKQTTTPFQASWGFPSGYPAPYSN